MSSLVYLNGRFVPEEQATLSVFDRATLFSDAVYEVTCVVDGQLFDYHAHMQRLKRSLTKLDMKYDVDTEALLAVHQRLIAENAIHNGMVYLQLSRGTADRSFRYSNEPEPNLFCFTQKLGVDPKQTLQRRLKLISTEEGRWSLLDIKTTQLLYASLVKTRVMKQGADDALFLNNGYVTETTAANFFIVSEAGTLVTCPLNGTLLPGITRQRILDLAYADGFSVEERLFTIDEVYKAREAFVTSAVNFATPVAEIDGKCLIPEGNSPVTSRLHKLYLDEVPKS